VLAAVGIAWESPFLTNFEQRLPGGVRRTACKSSGVIQNGDLQNVVSDSGKIDSFLPLSRQNQECLRLRFQDR